MIGSKSCELDERIPFIPKLRKYADLMEFENSSFKTMEVTIGQALDWNLHRTTFYSFVEMFLAMGVLTDDDYVQKGLVLKMQGKTPEELGAGAEDGVRYLAKGEQTRPVTNISDLHKISQTSPKQGFVRMGSLSEKVKAEIVKVFELYARDLSNLVVRDCKGFWNFGKSTVATAILLYTRTAMLDTSTIWSKRFELVCGLNLESVSSAFTRIEEFVRLGGVATAENSSSKKNPHPSTSSFQGPFSNYSTAQPLGESKILRNNLSSYQPIHVGSTSSIISKLTFAIGDENGVKPSVSSSQKTSTGGSSVLHESRLRRQPAQKENSPSGHGVYQSVQPSLF